MNIAKTIYFAMSFSRRKLGFVVGSLMLLILAVVAFGLSHRHRESPSSESVQMSLPAAQPDSRTSRVVGYAKEGKPIFYLKDGELWSVTYAGGIIQREKLSDTGIVSDGPVTASAVSPDGKWLAFISTRALGKVDGEWGRTAPGSRTPISWEYAGGDTVTVVEVATGKTWDAFASDEKQWEIFGYLSFRGDKLFVGGTQLLVVDREARKSFLATGHSDWVLAPGEQSFNAAMWRPDVISPDGRYMLLVLQMAEGADVGVVDLSRRKMVHVYGGWYPCHVQGPELMGFTSDNRLFGLLAKDRLEGSPCSGDYDAGRLSFQVATFDPASMKTLKTFETVPPSPEAYESAHDLAKARFGTLILDFSSKPKDPDENISVISHEDSLWMRPGSQYEALPVDTGVKLIFIREQDGP